MKSMTVTGQNSSGLSATHQTQYEYDGLGRQNKVIDAKRLRQAQASPTMLWAKLRVKKPTMHSDGY